MSSNRHRLLDRVRNACRRRGYSLHTEKTYCHWVKRYVLFHKKQHPGAMHEVHVRDFLSYMISDNYNSRRATIKTTAAFRPVSDGRIDGGWPGLFFIRSTTLTS